MSIKALTISAIPVMLEHSYLGLAKSLHRPIMLVLR
jgi:hypothetical protein